MRATVDLNAVVSRSTSLFKVLCLCFPFGSGYNVVCPRSIRPYHINRITRPLASPSKCYLHDSRQMIDEILGGDSWIIRCSRLDITSFLISSIRICISRTICRACFISTSSEAVPPPHCALWQSSLVGSCRLPEKLERGRDEIVRVAVDRRVRPGDVINVKWCHLNSSSHLGMYPVVFSRCHASVRTPRITFSRVE